MKTAKVKLNFVKYTDGWADLCYALKFERFKTDNPHLIDDELTDKFYEDVISKKFKYGEFADLELEVDENFNIVGGKIL